MEMTGRKSTAQFLRKVLTVLLVFSFFTFISATTAVTEARAEGDTMEHTLRSTIYGGIIGGLIGTAVLLVTDNPEDNLSYIPTGAGVGLLLGAAYGLASSGVVYTSAIEASEGELAFQIPEVQRQKLFDENTQSEEFISKIDVFKLRF